MTACPAGCGNLTDRPGLRCRACMDLRRRLHAAGRETQPSEYAAVKEPRILGYLRVVERGEPLEPLWERTVPESQPKPSPEFLEIVRLLRLLTPEELQRLKVDAIPSEYRRRPKVDVVVTPKPGAK